jgi:DNA-binding NarL/FixJ family response regulator
MFREMLSIALPRGGEFQIVGEAADAEEVMAVIDRLRPDVLLLDYKMPHVKNFSKLVGELREKSERTYVVVLSGTGSAEVARQASDGGASGYILKSTQLSAVADAVRTVANGAIWVDPSLPRKVFDIFQRSTHRAVDGSENGLAALTRREREVLACVAQGISNQEIAQRLCISEPTVKTHLTRIFAKLSVKNRLSAALAFYNRGQGARSESVVGEQSA